jgi:hypothetical protein
MVVGAMCTGLSVSRTATLLGFSTLNNFLCVSRMVNHPTVGSIGVNMGQHPCGTFDTL